MKKKIIIGSLLAVFMLVAISYATAVNNNTNAESKESPLFGIRTRRAVTEKISKLIDNVKTRFIGERVFFIPVKFLRDIGNRINPLYSCTDCRLDTCIYTRCDSCTWDFNGKACTSHYRTCDENPTTGHTCPGSGSTCDGIFTVLCCL
jgi:hypothetical protein